MPFCVPKSTTVDTCSQHMREIVGVCVKKAGNVVFFNCIKYNFNLVILFEMTKFKIGVMR